MTHRAEWAMQAEVANLLRTWLRADCYWTATDAASASSTAGKMRRLRGVRPGAPDLWVLCCGLLIGIELKSKCGRLSPAQLATRQQMLLAGAVWWECRSANAVMWVLHEEGVPFNMIAASDGTVQTWRQPELAPWEVPRRDPAEPRPAAPELAQQRRSWQRRWRQRQRRREAPPEPRTHAAQRQAVSALRNSGQP
jgi:hypothetical protein